MVFQNYGLYPHMSVAENIGYPLKLRGVDRKTRDARVKETAEKVELGALLKRRPSELSGGQRQRVALARAIVRTPKIFLMDEPLSNLDAKLRVSMRAELKHLHHELGVTTVFVTHDQMEAMTLATRVAVMRDGQIVQLDTPKKIYSEPVNLFVAGFIGSPSMNLVEGRITSGQFEAPGVRIAVTAPDRDGVVLGVRPEDLDLTEADPAPISGRLYALELTGDATLVTLRDKGTSICARGPAEFHAEINAPCALAPKPGARIHLFDKTSGERLPA
jgi:multiple sugar transport system ATP-binding protein